MKSMQLLRQAIGISQRELSLFIGGDHTQLHRIEKGERLPGQMALERIMLLQQAAAQSTASKKKEAIPKEISAQWLFHAEGCRIRITVLQRKLKKLQKKNQQCTSMLHLLQNLESMPHLTGRQQRWIRTQHYDATQQLKKCGEANLTELQIRISLLQKEAELYEKAAGKKKEKA